MSLALEGAPVMKGDGYVCQLTSGADEPSLSMQWLVGNQPPTVASDQDLVIRMESQKSDSTFSCKFFRPDVITDVNNFEYSAYNPALKNLYLLIAYGSMRGSSINYHDDRIYSSEDFDFKADPANVDPDDIEVRLTDPKIIAHGCLMLLAWLVLSRTAIFTAIFGRDTDGSGHPFRTTGRWFQVHQFCNIGAIVVTIPAVILAFKYNDWNFIGNESIEGIDDNRKYHAIFGISVVSIGSANFLMGFIRPNPDHKFRWVFNFFHKLFGYVAVGFSEYCLASGFYLVRLYKLKWPFWVFIGYVSVSFAVHILGPIYVNVSGNKITKLGYFSYLGFLGVFFTVLVIGLNVD